VKACRDSEAAAFPGTLLDWKGSVSPKRTQSVTSEILKAIPPNYGISDVPVAVLDMDMIKQKIIDAKTKLIEKRLDLLLRPFRQWSPFSEDLVKSAYMLNEFSLEMASAGWITKDFITNTQAQLAMANGRFTKFLDLMGVEDVGRLVAFGDIDLAWHTMQLDGTGYRDAVLQRIAKYSDHSTLEDSQEESMQALQNTANQWQKKYTTTIWQDSGVSGQLMETVAATLGSSNTLAQTINKADASNICGTSRSLSSEDKDFV